MVKDLSSTLSECRGIFYQIVDKKKELLNDINFYYKSNLFFKMGCMMNNIYILNNHQNKTVNITVQLFESF